ncbi:hypothetical protein HYS84_01335 [Candidatus Saccharibacteria bacterium]|nr:hypothetical protein [Candidatus Saccharibacteria bacterium]
MQNRPGVFIAIEGSDGSGKSTQFSLLAERLKAVGHEIEIIKFPRYDHDSSYFVRQYLAGAYGPADTVSPYTASIFYALDRFEAAPLIREALEKGKIVLCDRYVGANMAHQGAKFTNFSEQRGFFLWADSLEFQQLGIPRPDINLFLKVPVTISRKLIKRRASSEDAKLDEHEKNTNHLERAVNAYDLLCKLFPKDFREIICTKSGQLLSIIEINNLIWETIQPLLPPPRHRGRSAILKLDDALIGKLNEEPKTRKNQPKKATDKPPKRAAVSKEPEAALANKYKKTIGEIKKLRSQMLNQSLIDTSINRNELKAALQSTVPLSERPALAAKINLLKAVQIKSPADKTAEPQAMETIIKDLAQEHLPNISTDDEVQLIEKVPRNEFELLGKNIDALSYREKQQKLKDEFNKPSANLLDRVIYHFDIVADLLTLDFMIERGTASQLILEGLGPRYGYKVPEIIEAAGLAEQYNKSFKLANDLYSQLISRRETKLAVSSLLLGHRGRWKINLSAADLRLARKNAKASEFIDVLVEKIAESHPLTAQAINRTEPSLGLPPKPQQKKRRSRK